MKSLPGFAASLVLFILLACPLPSHSEESVAPKQPLADIAYKTGDRLGEYETQRCKLDLYLPPGGKNFATLVSFHGGGLKGGSKDDCRKDTPPMLVLAADHDMDARAEENEYLVATLKGAGNTRVTYQKFADRDHGSIAGKIPQPGDPVRKAILDFIAATPAATAR